MKTDIHPTYSETTVTCTCGTVFTTRSTKGDGKISAEVCSQCHPFYTGKQKILDTGGRGAHPVWGGRRSHVRPPRDDHETVARPAAETSHYFMIVGR